MIEHVLKATASCTRAALAHYEPFMHPISRQLVTANAATVAAKNVPRKPGIPERTVTDRDRRAFEPSAQRSSSRVSAREVSTDRKLDSNCANGYGTIGAMAWQPAPATEPRKPLLASTFCFLFLDGGASLDITGCRCCAVARRWAVCCPVWFPPNRQATQTSCYTLPRRC